jgi:hypothetical protein
MAFLKIAGKTYIVAHGNANEDQPTMIGALGRAFSGVLRRTVRVVKRQWTFTLGPMYDYEDALLRADVATAASVTVTGDAVAGVNVTCAVILGAASYVPDDPLFRRMRTVTCMEV